MDPAFRGEAWFWRRPAPHHVVSVRDAWCGGLDGASALVGRGWGMIPVTVALTIDG